MSTSATATNRRAKQKRRTKPRSHDRLMQEARSLATRLQRTPSQRQLCRELNIGAPKAREVLAELDQTPRLHLVDAAEEQPEARPEPATEAHPDGTPEPAAAAPETVPADAPVDTPQSAPQPQPEPLPEMHPEAHPAAPIERTPSAPEDAPASAPEEAPAAALPAAVQVRPETHPETRPEPQPETHPAPTGQMRGKASAWLAFAAGIVASVAANIAHSFVRPHNAPADWHWSWGAIMFAAFWPVALLLAVEVLTRVTWPNGRWYWLARYAGLTSVAVVAAAVSYSHMSALLASWSDAWVAVHVGPVAVDGLMTMAAAALLGLSKQRQEAQS